MKAGGCHGGMEFVDHSVMFSEFAVILEFNDYAVGRYHVGR